jgi:tetratricopeptide (TPR) repeat protein
VPLAAALRAAGASQVAAANPTSVSALGEILPELGPSGLPAEAARACALESMAALVGQLEPLALVIDDLQWVDPSTIGALADLCRRRAAMPLVVVGAFRSEEVPSDHPVRALDATLHLYVEPLTPDDVAPLGITGLHERTGGNPLFVVERLRAATEGAEDQIPDTLRDLIVARCRRAGADAHRLLVVASVVGRSFTPGLLMAMTGSHPAGLTPELEALCERRLLQRAAGGFDFRHDLIRQALYQSLSAESRIALHGRALRALEATGSDAGQLVHHALQAGALELAVRYATDAGDAARARWANIEAVAQYQRAREIADGHPGLLEAPALEALLLRLGRVLVTTGRTPDAEKSIHRARASAERRGDQQALFEALDSLAFARQRGASDPRGSLHHATAALEVAESIGDHVLLSRAHTMVGSPSGSLGLIDQALEHSEQAISHARAAGLDPPAYPMGRIAFMLRHRGRDIEVIDWTSRAEAAALTEHDEETLLMARWVRALALTDLGRHREAWQTLDSIADIGKGEEMFWHARVPNTYGSILADLGLFDRALDRDLESLEVARSSTAMPIREAELQTLLNLGADYLGLGRTAEARAQLEAVRRQADKVEYGRFRWLNRLHFLDAEVALVEGDADRGRVAADRCLELAATYGQAKYEVRGKTARARALAALGARPTAVLEARAAGQLAAQLSFPGLAWRAWWLAHGLSGAPQDRQRAQAEVMRIATGLDDDLRSAFLAAIPVQP